VERPGVEPGSGESPPAIPQENQDLFTLAVNAWLLTFPSIPIYTPC